MPAAPAPASEVRLRVMVGMIDAVEAKGYSSTTIADIARAAKISRRTLYEHFEDKEACFLAAYSMMSDELISTVVSAARSQPVGYERLSVATVAYLEALAASPEVALSFLTEINAVGQPGVDLRYAVNLRFATMLTDLVSESVGSTGTELPDGRTLRAFGIEMALALVGGINELVLHAIQTGPRDTLEVRIRRLSEPVVELADRMLVIGEPHTQG